MGKKRCQQQEVVLSFSRGAGKMQTHMCNAIEIQVCVAVSMRLKGQEAPLCCCITGNKGSAYRYLAKQVTLEATQQSEFSLPWNVSTHASRSLKVVENTEEGLSSPLEQLGRFSHWGRGPCTVMA